MQTIERASKGYQALAVIGSATISWTNYSAANDGSVAFLKLTGSLSSAATLTFPSYQHFLAGKNSTGASITIKCSGGTGVTVTNGDRFLLYCDGIDYYQASPTQINGILTGVSTGVANTDAVNVAQLAAAIAASVPLGTAGTFLNSITDLFRGFNSAKNTAVSLGGISYTTLNPGANEVQTAALDFTNLTVTTNIAAADRFAIYDATAAAMRYQTRGNVVGSLGLILQAVKNADFTASAGKMYPVDCTAGNVICTLPAPTASLGLIGIAKYGTFTLSFSGTINGATNYSTFDEFTYVMTDAHATRGWV